MNVYILFILLIVLIIVGVLLLISIAKPPEIQISETQPAETPPEIIKGGAIDKTKAIYIIDGLNYIYDKYLSTNKATVRDEKEEHIISNYPNQAYVWKAIIDLRNSHKKDNIIFVIKNQDGYKLSVYDDNLYKRWAKTYKVGIIVCYDYSKLSGAHYIKGRDDKTVCDLYDKYKTEGLNVSLISKDAYEDKSHFGSIPAFKRIIYGNVPFADEL